MSFIKTHGGPESPLLRLLMLLASPFQVSSELLLDLIQMQLQSAEAVLSSSELIIPHKWLLPSNHEVCVEILPGCQKIDLWATALPRSLIQDFSASCSSSVTSTSNLVLECRLAMNLFIQAVTLNSFWCLTLLFQHHPQTWGGLRTPPPQLFYSHIKTDNSWLDLVIIRQMLHQKLYIQLMKTCQICYCSLSTWDETLKGPYYEKNNFLRF